MRYPITIYTPRLSSQWHINVPDLPGCRTISADDYDEAIKQAKKAINSWIAAENAEGRRIPYASKVDNLIRDRRFEKRLWTVVDIDDPVNLDIQIFPNLRKFFEFPPQECAVRGCA